MAKLKANPRYATMDPKSGEGFSSSHTPVRQRNVDNEKIVAALQSYMEEADQNRKGGLNPRDDKWSQNLDLYWNRYDFSHKAEWQAKETTPEVSSYVDRFAAAMKEALVATPEGFYTIKDPADKEGDMGQAIKRMTDVWLSQTGRNQMGTILSFPAVFEEQVKMGSIMASAAVVTWKHDTPSGRVAIETVDPRNVWLDHTYRNLYRIRRIEVDRHELSVMLNATDNRGDPIYNTDEMELLIAGMEADQQREAEEASGHGHHIVSGRSPIQLDEYIATVVDSTGKKIHDKALFVVANGQYLIRGPEPNPFWHGKDWLTYTPFVIAPLSVYGRSYMEDFGSVAKTFNELTNMILDAVHTSSLNMYAIVPGMLLNPGQVAEGLKPNKLWQLEEGFKAQDFAQKLEMGNLSADSLRVWEELKRMLSAAADMNEIGLGQFAPNSRTSATEIQQTQQSSSALIRSVAQTVETRWLDPVLDLVWKTGIQHMSEKDEMLRQAAGEEMFRAILARRREFASHNFTFQARGISSLIARSQQNRALLQVLGIIGQNDILMQTFLQEIDPVKLVKRLLELSGIDITTLQTSERDRMMQAVVGPLQEKAGAGTVQLSSGTGLAGNMNALARTMGIGRGM